MAAPETPIAFMLPTTQAITISNASSPLLRLPQELKDRIYHFVYGGFYLHIQKRQKDPRICLVARKTTTPHSDAIHFNDGMVERLPVASLGTCRQMYHDARNVLYSVNTFSSYDRSLIFPFLKHLKDVIHRNLAVRSIHLDVFVRDTADERKSNHTFCALAENLKNLRDIHIDVAEHIWNRWYVPTRRHSPAYTTRPFLQGLLELKKLPLKRVELVVAETIWDGQGRGSEYVWTTAQKQEWAQKMRRAILGLG
ncbi:MAG: hypothetical protein ALECFALPRED_010334 [Alectoria fallacina]|uniref:DUF7730 domain-containing protein n=1 Tax=Alectoria fallacina TaxID=1903189 RepID=A0A8H3F0D9_9LECA|nr:MAG: hypothetical protein ALECFALPRED_010334 [Alectoria fallacina]